MSREVLPMYAGICKVTYSGTDERHGYYLNINGCPDCNNRKVKQ